MRTALSLQAALAEPLILSNEDESGLTIGVAATLSGYLTLHARGCENSVILQKTGFAGSAMKIAAILLSLIFGAVSVAAAQDNPQWELFGGYQYTRLNTGNAQNELNLAAQTLGIPPLTLGSNLNLSGWDSSLQENSNHWAGGVLDFSGNYVTRNLSLFQLPGSTGTLRDRIRFYTFMGGPQLTLRKSGVLQPFARALFGGATLRVEITPMINGAPAAPTSTGSDTGFAMGGGGGVDFHLLHHVAVRVAGDYIRAYLGGDSAGHLRVSGGLDFRIGSK